MAYAYPTGIQHLMSASELKVRQKRLGFGGNKYEVLTVNGDIILKAKEGTGLGSLLGGSSRSFHMHVYDMQQNLIFSLRRPYTFGSDKMEVSLNGEVVAVVRQQPTFMTPILHINDANDSMIVRLKGDWSEWFFKLQTSDKTRIGSVDKKWGGFLKEAFTNQDTYMVKFPQDLDVRLKAAVLGSCVLIDYMYNER